MPKPEVLLQAREEVGAVPLRGELVPVASLRSGQGHGCRRGDSGARIAAKSSGLPLLKRAVPDVSSNAAARARAYNDQNGHSLSRPADRDIRWLQANALSAFMAIFTSRRARIPGWRRWRRRTRPRPTTTGTSASARSATPQRRGAHCEQQEPDHAHREQLRAHELQLRAHAAELAQGECAAHLSHDSRRRAPQPQELRGHSSAMAQVYNHIIMPLASERDRITQIRWGIADYREPLRRARPRACGWRRPRPTPRSLELLAQHGIKFTVLAPHQCKRIRPAPRQTERDPSATAWTTLPAICRHNAALSGAL